MKTRAALLWLPGIIASSACAEAKTEGSVDALNVDIAVASDLVVTEVHGDASEALDTPASADTAPDSMAADAPVAEVAAVDVSAPEDLVADIPEPLAPCPSIEVLNGLDVSPPVLLNLSGAATTGDVARWRWTVVAAPAHSFSGIGGAHSREATFEAAVAGAYTFRLEAWDPKDRAACDPAEVTVQAVPTAAIHLELWWDDNTQDPTAEIGADLDLHVMHPNAIGIDVGGDAAPDGWFDPVYDVAWHNPTADWPGPVGDEANGPRVRLLRRDDSGYGPEVVSIERPRDGDVYTVGFHIWDDALTSYLQPTEVRVYINGVLKNRPNYAVPLHAHILERVMTVRWPFEGQQSLGFPFARDGDMVPAAPTKE